MKLRELIKHARTAGLTVKANLPRYHSNHTRKYHVEFSRQDGKKILIVDRAFYSYDPEATQVIADLRRVFKLGENWPS